MTHPNRIERTTVANAAENARLAPIPRAQYELPGWLTLVGGTVCALALAFVADPLALGFALPGFVLTLAKILAFVGGALGLAGGGVRFAAHVPLARPVESRTVVPMRAPRDDRPIPFEPEDRAP